MSEFVLYSTICENIRLIKTLFSNSLTNPTVVGLTIGQFAGVLGLRDYM